MKRLLFAILSVVAVPALAMESIDSKTLVKLNEQMFWAIMAQDDTTIKKLLASGAQADATHCLGRTSLVCAIDFNNESAIKILLDSGAQVDKKDSNGNTALMLAAGCKHDSEWGCYHGSTCLYLIARALYHDFKEILLPHMGFIQISTLLAIRDKEGKTANAHWEEMTNDL